VLGLAGNAGGVASPAYARGSMGLRLNTWLGLALLGGLALVLMTSGTLEVIGYVAVALVAVVNGAQNAWWALVLLGGLTPVSLTTGTLQVLGYVVVGLGAVANLGLVALMQAAQARPASGGAPPGLPESGVREPRRPMPGQGSGASRLPRSDAT
jgi:hypothetical protein